MATGPAKSAAVNEPNDWQTAPASDWQDVKTTPDAPVDTRNSMQKSFDENTKTSPDEPLLETGLKSVVSGIGQPLVHPIETAKSMGKMAMHPLDSAHEEVNELHEHPAYGMTKLAGNAFGGMALGAGIGALPDAAGAVTDMIPTRAKAGAVLENLDKTLKDTPVNLNHSADPLQRATELSVRTGASPAPFNAFLSRTQGMEPMSFPEARDYQSGMSSPSVMDRLSTSGKMRGAVKQLNKNFFTDIQDAAENHTPGLGEDYAKGMRDYKNAARLNTAAKMAGAGAAASIAGPKLLKYLKPLVAE